MGWLTVDDGYEVALVEGRVTARSTSGRSAGRQLKSLPKELRDHPEVDRLRRFAQWLDRHAAECLARVDHWMVSSLPVPTELLARVWPDEAWRSALRGLVVVGGDPDEPGFLRDVTDSGGLRVVNLDGRTVRMSPPTVLLPHPVLLPGLDELREFAAESGVVQQVEQIHRATWSKPDDLGEWATEVREYLGQAYPAWSRLAARATSLGYRVSGGYAVSRVRDAGRTAEAAVWIGVPWHDRETVTGSLSWNDGDGRTLRLREVGPVAWSEGMRMAAALNTGSDPQEPSTAGAVLPPVTEGAGERAAHLTARAYRHPGLADRTVVRLVPGERAEAEDLVVGLLGMEPDGRPETADPGLRQAPGFPERVLERMLVHHPEDGHRALALVPEPAGAAQRAKTGPKAALAACQKLADRLAVSVPHVLPTFYEQAGRVFLGVDDPALAGRMFTAARKAEAEHGLAVDADRLDAVFLEFALAGALPETALSAHARELAERVPAAEALRRFVRLCVRLTAGGLPPLDRTAADVRRLARAAGQSAGEAEQEYLSQLLGPAATMRAAASWWTAHRVALAALARRDAGVRGLLLNTMPHTDDGLSLFWLWLLVESGADAGLCDDEVPAEESPADGSVGWLERYLAFWRYRWGGPDRNPRLYALVERMAPKLRRELAERGAQLPFTGEVDLLDLLLSLDIPVAAPGDVPLRLEPWARGEGQRDLLALAADPRFRPAFHHAADSFCYDADAQRVARLLAASAGGRTMVAEWVQEIAEQASATHLPQLPRALGRLSRIPGEALAVAADDVREATDRRRVDELLARTLRGGLFDELSWPAWEEAAAALVQEEDVDTLRVAEAWPHLIVAGPTQVRVIGPEGTVLTHDLRVPAGDDAGRAGFHFVDGELLVHWKSRALDGALRGYWHTSPGRLQPLEGPDSPREMWMESYSGFTGFSLPLPAGGRATGGGVLHRGDTVLPAERPVVSDGTSYWVWKPDEDGSATFVEASGTSWYEYDPISGEQGRRSMPPFFADALGTAPRGSTLRTGRLLPAAPAGAVPAPAQAGPSDTADQADGLLGWCVLWLPDGSRRGEDPAGHAVTVPPGQGSPVHVLLFPGDDRPRAVVRGSYEVSLVDPDGMITATAETGESPGPFAAGTLILPPVEYWHCLRPRDPEGSAVLRGVDPDTAAALLTAARDTEGKDLEDAIRALLPGIGRAELVAGVAGAVRYSARQQAVLDSVGGRLTEASYREE